MSSITVPYTPIVLSLDEFVTALLAASLYWLTVIDKFWLYRIPVPGYGNYGCYAAC